MLADESVGEDTRQYEARDFPSKERCRVLNVGCGNSHLGEHMLQSGFTDIVNVDYSEVVINKSELLRMMYLLLSSPWLNVDSIKWCSVREKYDANFFADLRSRIEKKELLCNALGLESRDDSNHHASTRLLTPKMTFEVGDIAEGMNHPDESFDLIICKKTLDFILCGAGSAANAKSMMTECYRLLNKDHGVMMILSTAKPEDRAYFYEQNPWSGVENIKLPIDQKKGHER